MIVIFFCVIYYKKERFDIPNTAWGHKESIEYNNCYAYAFNDIDSSRTTKPQPGFKKNLPPLVRNQFNCKSLIDRVSIDYPNAIYIGNDPELNHMQCEEGHYLVFLAVDNEGEERDYHFYKRNNEGFWSHKPGNNEVFHTDGNNEIISNPYYANRTITSFNYTIPCGYFVV